MTATSTTEPAQTERDKFMTPQEAVEYGLADKIVTNRADDDKE